MKEIKLKRITIKNFKAQNATADFSDNTTTISGINGIGKSNIMKAYLWCFTGNTDAVHGKNHELYDNKVDLGPHTPEVSVKCEITIDGEHYSIERRAKAKFVRKRGSDIYEKAPSDTYTYLIDGLEFTSGEFDSWVENSICAPELLPYVLSGEFFSVLTETDRNKARQVLQGIVGNVEASEMKGNYETIGNLIGKYTIAQIAEKYKNERKPLVQRLQEIPAVIQKIQQDISSYRNIIAKENYSEEEDAIKRELQRLNDELNASNDKLKPELEKREEVKRLIDEKTAELRKAETAYYDKISAETRKAAAERDEIARRNAEIDRHNRQKKEDYDNAHRKIKDLQLDVESLEEKLNEKRKELDEINTCIFTEDKCAYCGQPLPEDLLQEKIKEFNIARAKRINAIFNEGKNIRAQIDQRLDEIDECEKIIECGVTIEKNIDYEPQHVDMTPFHETEEYKRLQAEISAIELPQMPEIDNSGIIARQQELYARLQEINTERGSQTFAKGKLAEAEEQVISLQNEQRETAAEVARCEKAIDECKMYEEEKANIISERINEHLPFFSIQMYEVQKNGEKTPACIIVDNDGVKYATINNAARICINIYLQRLFNEKCGVSTPYFVDECSVINEFNLPKFSGMQLIKLYCSDDTKLTITHEN